MRKTVDNNSSESENASSHHHSSGNSVMLFQWRVNENGRLPTKRQDKEEAVPISSSELDDMGGESKGPAKEGEDVAMLEQDKDDEARPTKNIQPAEETPHPPPAEEKLPDPPPPEPPVPEPAIKKRLTKTIVEVGVIFAKVGEIDTVKEQYSADVYIQSRWREPELDNKEPEDLLKANLKELWSPHLYIDNELSSQKDSTWQTASLNDNGEAFISERRKLRGVFFENLELQTFPLDVQDLSVSVVSERTEDEVELIADRQIPSTVNVGTFADEQEWKLYQHVEVTQKTMTIQFASHEHRHSALQVTALAARRAAYFYYNVFLVMFFITSMAFATFAIDALLPQNRLQLAFTLLLTAIAFKMAMNQSLPKISYLTYMDKYVLLSITFLVLVCIWHAIVPSICGDRGTSYFYTNKSEGFVLLAFFAIYIVGHALFVVYVYIQAGKRRRHVEQKERQFHAKKSLRQRATVKV